MREKPVDFLMYWTGVYFSCLNNFANLGSSATVSVPAQSITPQSISDDGTDLSVVVQLVSGKTLLQEKNSTGHRWDSNPSPCR